MDMPAQRLGVCQADFFHHLQGQQHAFHLVTGNQFNHARRDAPTKPGGSQYYFSDFFRKKRDLPFGNSGSSPNTTYPLLR